MSLLLRQLEPVLPSIIVLFIFSLRSTAVIIHDGQSPQSSWPSLKTRLKVTVEASKVTFLSLLNPDSAVGAVSCADWRLPPLLLLLLLYRFAAQAWTLCHPADLNGTMGGTVISSYLSSHRRVFLCFGNLLLFSDKHM